MQAVAQRAARFQAAAAVRRAILKNAVSPGPGQTPRPCGEGVQSSAFREALPFLRWDELVGLASAFERRGVSELAFGSSLAAEIAARLQGHGVEHADESSKHRQEQASAREVAAVAFAFSKMRPEVPAEMCVGLFSAIADGIRAEEWPFTWGQETVLSVSFAEASVHEDLLPQLLQNTLRHITKVTESELRYVVHAAAKLPSPGLNEQDAILVAQRIQEMIGSMSFGSGAHLLISWLKIRVTGEAREPYFEVLGTICSHLTAKELKPTRPTWPIPTGTLAYVLNEFVEAENKHNGEPLLSIPVFRQVVGALVRIQRGKNEKLDLEEWVSILQTVSDFCGAHGSAMAQMRADGTVVLPRWAHDVFSYICGAAYRDRLRETGLDPLLQLLRLVGHHTLHRLQFHESHKVFLRWCAERLENHSDACDDPSARARILEVYLPLVSEEERQSFLHRTRNSDTRLKFFEKASQNLDSIDLKETRVMLTSEPAVQQSSVSAALGFSAGMAPPTTENAKINGSFSTARASSSAAAPLHQRVWGMLGAAGPVIGSTMAPHVVARNGIPQGTGVQQVEIVSPTDAEPVVDNDSFETHESAEALQALASVREMEASFRQALDASTRGPKELEHLRTELQRFSQRLEVLEKQLATQGSTARENVLISAVKGFAQEIMRSDMSQQSDFTRKSNAKATMDASHTGSPRTFDFETWRKQQSGLLQQQRERVLIPAERVAVVPLHHK